MNLDLRYMFGAPGAWRNWLHQFRGKNYTLQDLDQLKKVKKIRFFLAEGGGGVGVWLLQRVVLKWCTTRFIILQKVSMNLIYS